MLIPLSQKAEASETVSPVVRSLAGRAFIKGVGLSQVRSYQKTACHLQRLLLASLLLNPISKRTYPSQPTRGLGFPVTQMKRKRDYR